MTRHEAEGAGKEAPPASPAADRYAPVLRTVTVNGVPTQAVVFPYRRLRAGLLTLGGAVFAVLGLGFMGSAAAIFYLLTLAPSHDAPTLIPAALLGPVFALLGAVTAGYFGLTSIGWAGALVGRTYVALTAHGLVLRHLPQRAVVPWDDLNVPRMKSYGLERYLALRLRKRATVPLPLMTRWNRRASRYLGLGEFDLWIPENAIGSAALLERAIRWHKKAPRTEEALLQGHLDGWNEPFPQDGKSG